MKDKLELDIVLEDSGDLMNQYTIIAENSEKYEGINKKSAEAFVKFDVTARIYCMTVQMCCRMEI